MPIKELIEELIKIDNDIDSLCDCLEEETIKVSEDEKDRILSLLSSISIGSKRIERNIK